MKRVADFFFLGRRSRFRDRPVMNDRYLLLNLLGKGGFSEVWLAFDLDAAKRVALKFPQLDHAWSDEKKRSSTRDAIVFDVTSTCLGYDRPPGS